MDTTTANKNPLRAALDDLAERGTRNAVRALVDATDRSVERHQVHAWARPDGYPPSAEQRSVLDLGLKRLGMRRGLSESAWKPWIKGVQSARRAADKRRAEVREREGLPPFRGSSGRAGGGRAPQDTAPAE